MSLHGYVKKGKAANWMSVAGAQPVRFKMRKSKDVPKFLKKFDAVQKRTAKSSLVLGRRSEKRKADRAWSALSKRLVAEANARGETCPVVNNVQELRYGVKYGHLISATINQCHHVRGRLGDLLLDERYLLPVSMAGHRYIHAHPDIARQNGWLCEKGSWGKRD